MCLYFLFHKTFLKDLFPIGKRAKPYSGWVLRKKESLKVVQTDHHHTWLPLLANSLWFITLFWFMGSSRVLNHIRAHTLANPPKTFTFLRSPPWQYSIASSGRSLVATCFCIPSGTSLAATTLTWSNLREPRWADIRQQCIPVYFFHCWGMNFHNNPTA